MIREADRLTTKCCDYTTLDGPFAQQIAAKPGNAGQHTLMTNSQPSSESMQCQETGKKRKEKKRKEKKRKEENKINSRETSERKTVRNRISEQCLGIDRQYLMFHLIKILRQILNYIFKRILSIRFTKDILHN